jgi:hypothetical protein
MALTDQEILTNITNVKNFWFQRNKRFKEWYQILTLIDLLAAKRMESYVSNEPQTFYNMAHYLITKGVISHTSPIITDSGSELDRIARIDRGCTYMWNMIDRLRRAGGGQPFVDELSFYLLTLGWYSVVLFYDEETGFLKPQIWNPYETYPEYVNETLAGCLHSYTITETEAIAKATAKDWIYTPTGIANGKVVLDDYFRYEGDSLKNKIFINGKCVTGTEWIDRPEMKLMVAPVGGFPDKGSLTDKSSDWRKLAGRSIFECNATVTTHFNKWKTMISQILRDGAQPITQEFSQSPQAKPETLRERGALFHYTPGELGLQRVPPPQIPIEIQANLIEIRREAQKGSFNDAVFGMADTNSGYSLSLLASSSANQILYPYMDSKHFIFSESDAFWLGNTRKSGKTFQIKGKFLEKIEPKDIPEEVFIEVESNVATPKDWLERATIGNMLDKKIDKATILTEIYGMRDPQGIQRRLAVDDMVDHPTYKLVSLINSFNAHADYLLSRGDKRQAALFRKAASLTELQLSAAPAGAGKPMGVQSQDAEGANPKKTRVSPDVQPPEERGFTPMELRKSIGTGSLRTINK